MANETATISKGIKLSYKAGEAFTELTDLQEIPELGGDTESIEITTLADAAHKYTDGIKNYGDSLPFKFLYKKAQSNDFYLERLKTLSKILSGKFDVVVSSARGAGNARALCGLRPIATFLRVRALSAR